MRVSQLIHRVVLGVSHRLGAAVAAANRPQKATAAVTEVDLEEPARLLHFLERAVVHVAVWPRLALIRNSSGTSQALWRGRRDLDTVE